MTDASEPDRALNSDQETRVVLDNPLWTFALDFYGRPSVAASLLRLQDGAGIDVIHILLVVFGHRTLGHAFSAEDLASSRQAMTDWREAVVLPLRKIRKDLSQMRCGHEIEPMYVEAKKAELLAEQFQIAFAYRWLCGRATTPGLPLEKSLRLLVGQYAGRGRVNEHPVSEALEQIIDAATTMD